MFQWQGANFRESKIQRFAGTNTTNLVYVYQKLKNVSYKITKFFTSELR
jgi:hypothetical protein